VTAPAVTVYTTGFCGSCLRVTALLARQGIRFTEVNVEDHPGLF
jgi:mycoredoxin